MEIGLARKGNVQVLTLKGRIRREHWKVIDKHLDALLAKGCRCLVIDLDGVEELCTAGLGALFGNMKKFRDRDGRLLLIAGEPRLRKTFEFFGTADLPAATLFPDWSAAEKCLTPRP